MDSEVPVPVGHSGRLPETFARATLSSKPGFTGASLRLADAILPETVLLPYLNQISQLNSRAQVALIHQLMTQLDSEQIQAIAEFALREIAQRQRSSVVNQQTRLLLKKDYSYQERGLEQPTQYYVYLRRRKPKLDRYIGALFYVPQGCTLSYSLDTEERIIFHAPCHFKLKDSHNPAVVQVVRLLSLEPPPPDYTFDKQPNDTPQIRLHLEYLNPQTLEPIRQVAYPFPSCMYEGGQLDRYRWEVEALPVTAEPAAPAPVNSLPELQPEPLPLVAPSPEVLPPRESPQVIPAAKVTRRVLEIPTTKALVFHLSDRRNAEQVIKRMRLWVSWSEKSMPLAKWKLVQEGSGYVLMSDRFKRRILSYDTERATVTLENSLPVLMKWFHDLGLAVSQTQNQRQYSTTQLKLAHSLFVEMSLPQNQPAVVLKTLFGAEFTAD